MYVFKMEQQSSLQNLTQIQVAAGGIQVHVDLPNPSPNPNQQYRGHKTVHLEFIHGMAVDANCARLAMGGTLSSYEYAVLLSWCRPTCFAGRFCYVINSV